MTHGHLGKSIAQLSVLIQSGSLDPVALVEESFDAIRTHKDQAIFTRLLDTRAKEEAAASSRRLREGRSRGLLDGIPVAWKDLFAVAGLPTTAGSIVLADAEPAQDDADVVKALKAAGMVAVGRVNMSEFAFSGLGLNPHYGTPLNPLAPDVARIPGGSSSGSAVAVAAGLVPVSIGTDTGGSVRIPSAFNGLVGYKASRGRYSMAGVFPLATSLDSLGPLCRSVQDAVWVDAAMRGRAAPDVMRASLDSLSIVVPTNIVMDDVEDGVAEAFQAGLARLTAAGVKVRHAAFPAFDRLFQVMAEHGPLVTAEAFAVHHRRLAGPEAERMDRRVVARTRLGEKITLVGYLEILKARERLIEDIAGMIGPNELVAYPTVAHVAPALAPLEVDDELFVSVNFKTLRNTLIGNFLDWCGVSLPCGTGEAGMPAGLLLSAPHGRDDYLLAMAMALEDIVAG
ncbi:aspartyl-tRNA(Asn)/glutamyl-tRNA(Gln) amidotransferase subunit A [Rhizobium sp. BK275]|uniref:amidase n=1 Tax=unclassified Rhizobium TaxID=2613769 RepID=UPI001616D809|nr:MULTISPECIES: amidase [unclassified Rhizobium]MBB3388048.1 aspartyl-tRNA(Asn)/glutamyl-tRNA(Gln) amidotransferase subunit A [Rhizobium sp. BK275]MBB3407398.1 aspartyl-tRNA(Asn)/glutamyl-tRNA(Gln) amidotransferase subunit A [Rhizobium sp. BK316]